MLSKQLWIRGEGKSGIHLTEVSVFARMAGKNKHFRDLSQQVLSGVVAKNTDDKNRKNRKNNKYHKIQNLERQEAKKGLEISANVAKIAKVTRIFVASYKHPGKKYRKNNKCNKIQDLERE